MVSRHSVGVIALLAGGLVLCDASTGHAQALGHMSAGKITTTPAASMQPKVVRQYINRTKYALQNCYRKRLKDHPKLRGLVIARFVVKRDGSVARSRASGIKHDVADCVARTIATIVFPKPATSVRVKHTFMFGNAPRVHLHQVARISKLIRSRGIIGSRMAGRLTGSVKVTSQVSAAGMRAMKKLLSKKSHNAGQISGKVKGKLRGSSRKAALGPANGRVRLGKRRSPQPIVRAGKVTLAGSLAPAIIRRYLRRLRPRLARCYSRYAIPRKTQKAPRAKRGHKRGPVIRTHTSFVIKANGRVTRINLPTLKGSMAACVRGALSRLRFPKPRGGGSVKVSYPYHFKPAPAAKRIP